VIVEFTLLASAIEAIPRSLKFPCGGVTI